MWIVSILYVCGEVSYNERMTNDEKEKWGKKSPASQAPASVQRNHLAMPSILIPPKKLKKFVVKKLKKKKN